MTYDNSPYCAQIAWVCQPPKMLVESEGSGWNALHQIVTWWSLVQTPSGSPGFGE